MTVRCIYRNGPPDFPASDQHPDAKRYGPLTLDDGSVVFVDAVGGAPTAADVIALMDPPTQSETPQQRLAAMGLSVADLKALLALPT